MRIVYEMCDLRDFDAWSGGRTTLDRIIEEDKHEELEQILDEICPDGMTETELNDLLWFDWETVFEWLGIEDEEEEDSDEE